MKNIVRKCFALAQIRWASYTGNNKRKGWNADLPDSNITKHAIAAALKELCGYHLHLRPQPSDILLSF